MQNKGFTIIEAVISVSIGIVLIFVIANLLVSVLTSPGSQMASMDNIEQAKTVTGTFVSELRSAATGNDGSFSINAAGSDYIVFYSTYRSAGNAVKKIRYYLSGNILYKGVITPTGNPLTYYPEAEIIEPVITVVSNESTPVFSYYDGSYNGSGYPLSQPVNINEVRFVKINLMIKNQISNQDDIAFPISAGAAIRNLKDNLGN